VEWRGRALPIEVKSGKDYEVHRALSNIMQCGEYDFAEALVLNNENLRVDGPFIYAPIYMMMFLERRVEIPMYYTVDLTGM
jgi:muramoyltetrapeptide carboxypeptidase LdcA involved in peptidoglycan recycling